MELVTFAIVWLVVGLIATIRLLRYRWYPVEIHIIIVLIAPAVLVMLVPELVIGLIREKT